eukprot:COSAG02_NODE_17193_length_1022_cov_1.310943_1_plen_44_part_10
MAVAKHFRWMGSYVQARGRTDGAAASQLRCAVAGFATSAELHAS